MLNLRVCVCIPLLPRECLTDFHPVALDRSMGNPEGDRELTFKSPDQGAATTAYAALSPELSGNVAFPYLKATH